MGEDAPLYPPRTVTTEGVSKVCTVGFSGLGKLGRPCASLFSKSVEVVGYDVVDRARDPKPWDHPEASLAELLPYTLAAEAYFDVAGARWPTATRWLSRLLRWSPLGSPLAGIPFAVVDELRELATRTAGGGSGSDGAA